MVNAGGGAGAVKRQCAIALDAASGVGAESRADCAQISLRRRFRQVFGCRSGRFCNDGENAMIQGVVDALNIRCSTVKGCRESRCSALY